MRDKRSRSGNSPGEYPTPDASTDESNESTLQTSRRTYLKTVPAAFGLAGLANVSTAAAATWETNADNRIQEHRKATIETTVVDSSGNEVSNAEVDVAMVEHDYDFGTAINAEYFQDSSSSGGNYRQYARDLFNKAQMENRHKWKFWENETGSDEKQEAIDTCHWLLDRGLDVHGHTAIWQHLDYSLPQRIVDELNKSSPDDQYLVDETEQRVSDFVSYWSDEVGFTEVCVQNEPTHETAVTDEINENDPQFQPSQSVSWFDVADGQADIVDLYTNEYNVINQGGNADYKSFINHLIDSGAPLDAIGMQGHHWGKTPQQDASALLGVLDEFHGLDGHPIQILEYDTADMTNFDKAGNYLYKFLKVIYSHPATVGFNVWGFFSGRHWKDQAPLFKTDWTPKPAYYRYVDLVFNQWWTNTTGTTDSTGTHSTDAFLGTYQITARANGERGTATVTVRDPTHTEQVTVQMDSSGVSATDVVQAENADDYSGVDVSGDAVSSADDGDWVKYGSVDFGTGVDRFEALLGTANPGNTIEVRLDGPTGTKIGTMTVSDTGGIGTFSRQSVAVSSASDVHDVYLRFVGGSGVATVDRFRFVRHGRPTDSTAPAAPANLTSPSHADDSVDLDWDPSTDDATGIDEYHVYRDGTKAESVDAGTTQTTVTGLSAGTSYDFHVTAVDGTGNESTNSNTVTVTTNQDTSSAPAIDTFAVQNNSNGGWAKFTIDWAVSDADGDLSSLRLEMRQDGSVVDSASPSVSGSDASGQKTLMESKGSGTYDLVVSVRDAERNTTSQTKTRTA